MHAAYMVICSIILSFAAGVWASTCGYYLCFAEHTIKEIEMEFAKVLLFFWHLLWNSPDASHSFKLNLTVVVYAVITSAIKVSEWGMSIHLSFWKTYCLRISRKRFFFFFPEASAKKLCGFIYHRSTPLFHTNGYFSPAAQDSSHTRWRVQFASELIAINHAVTYEPCVSARWPWVTMCAVTQSRQNSGAC